MPRIRPHAVAQRVRYPNGTASDPFIAPWSKANMVRFARRVIDGQWPERVLGADGMIDVEKTAALKASDDFSSGSARLACAHDGRFWSTARLWSRVVHDYSAIPVDAAERALTQAEVGVLFHRDDEFGWNSLQQLRLGVVDSLTKALARTVLEWSRQIEEWNDVA